MVRDRNELDGIIVKYVAELKSLLGKDFLRACIYGSYARGEYGEDSDIDIAIFTDRPSNEFFYLLDKIAEVTFEYNVRYDVMLSPVFQNEYDFERMRKVLPYFQSIQKEGVLIG